jgi:hypothetical protein
MSIAGESTLGCERRMTCFAGHRPVGRVEAFVFMKVRFRQGAVSLGEHTRPCSCCCRVPKTDPASNLRKSEPTARVRKGVSRVRLISDSPSAHLAREVGVLRRHR